MLEPAEVRIRVMSVRLGAAATFAIALAGLFYYRATPGGLHRPLMTALAWCFMAGSALLLVAPVRGLVAGRGRTAFFVVWSAVSTGAIAVLYWLDGGGRSPIAYGLILALAFAAFQYPLRGAAAVAALVVGGYVAAALARPHVLAEVVFVAAALTCTSVMSVWTAWWRHRQRDELARLSRTDPLTGTLNRRGLDEAVAGALAAAEPFGLITLDLDGFKAINDTGGHAAGDALLADVVASLRAVLRPGDVVGRLGGDEFAVLLPGASPAAAARVRDRAQLALSLHAPASFGLALHPFDGRSADALLHAADEQMYAAKAARRTAD